MAFESWLLWAHSPGLGPTKREGKPRIQLTQLAENLLFLAIYFQVAISVDDDDDDDSVSKQEHIL